MARVRRIDLLQASYTVGFIAAGGSWETLSKAFAHALDGVPCEGKVVDVSDLRILSAVPDGLNTRVYVECEAFEPVLCCWGKLNPWSEAAARLQGLAGERPAQDAQDVGQGRPAPDVAPQGGTP